MKKNLDTGEFMPIILSELRTQNSELRTQNSNTVFRRLYKKQKTVVSWEKKFFQGMAVFLRLNGIFPNVVFLSRKVSEKFHWQTFCFGGLWKNSESGFFAWGVFGKIPKTNFLLRKRSEKFRRLTFCLGSVWKNSAGRLSS